MNKKTVGMIKFLKKSYDQYNTLREAAIAYMSQYSGCPEEIYTSYVIEQNIFEIFCDFMDAIDKPSTCLRFISSEAASCRFSGNGFNIYDLILNYMFLVDVMENGQYVNGFKKEDWEEN